MEIIKLAPEDWEKYKKIRLEAFQKDSLAFGTSHEEGLKKKDEEWKATLKKDGRYLFFAKVDDEIVGMVAAYQEEGERVHHVAYVWGVYVRETFRGQGIGKKLMEALLDELEKNNVVKANLNVNTAQANAVKLYESLGFQIIGTAHKEMYIDGKFHDEFLMEKIF